MSEYVVKHHKGHSGRSVYEWRVYHVWQLHGRTGRTQLAKYRTKEAAERAAEHYRNRQLTKQGEGK